MKKDAILDKTRRYRYVLKRQWGADDDNFVTFVLLNPSTADENTDDPTVKACIKFAQNWGYDGMWVTNLFAFRATEPADLKKAGNPVGEFNDSYIKEYAKRSKIVIIAWGNHGDFLSREKEVVTLLSKITAPHCLQILKNGSPKHPLYVHRGTKAIEFNSRGTSHNSAQPAGKILTHYSVNNEQNELKKAYVNLIALKQNLPQQHRLEEKYANMFNSELERLIKLGFDIEDFKIPSEELKLAFTGGNYITGEMRHSKNKYVERPVLLIKLDAILAYFSIETPETKIGFKTS